VCYLVAESFDRDPFAVMAWRGRDREAVLAALRRLRSTGGAVDGPDLEGAPGPPDGADSALSPAPRVAVDDAGTPLADALDSYWRAGPGLSEVEIRPQRAELPAAVLRHLPVGLIEVRGRDVADLLSSAYETIAASAARRALGEQ
jgi:uncharacterized Zn finger protein